MNRQIFKVNPKEPETTAKILKLLRALGHQVHDVWLENDYVINRAVWLYVYNINANEPIGWYDTQDFNIGMEYIDLTKGFERPDTHITFADGTRVELSLESWRELRS